MWKRGLLAFAIAVPVFPAFTQSSPQEREACTTTVVTAENGSRQERRYCKDESGAYVRVGTRPLPMAPLPERSEVTYAGTYRFTVTQPGRPIQRLDLNSILRAAGPSKQFEGAMTVRLRIDGNSVTGDISGTGGIRSSRVSGLFREGRCRVVSADTSVVYEGLCGRAQFSGRVVTTDSARTRVSGTFELASKAVVDIAERERTAALAAQAVREEAERKAARVAALRDQLEAEAARGGVKAMTLLAYAYSEGAEGFEIDYARAAHWATQAAARGDISSMRQLSTMYYYGRGVPQSAARAYQYSLQCASTNAPSEADQKIKTICIKIVAASLYSGIGTLRNENAAVKWYRLCASRDDDSCINWLNEHNVR